MVTFMVRRLLLAVFTIIAISILSFLIIHLPPGDYVTTYIAQIASSGGTVSAEEAANLRILYGLDQPEAMEGRRTGYWIKSLPRRARSLRSTGIWVNSISCRRIASESTTSPD